MRAKSILRRIMAVAVSLCLSMTWSASALASLAYADEPAGSFTLVAVSPDGVFVGPEDVPYEGGQTVIEALQATSHSFVVDPSSGFLSGVDGHSDGFTLYLQDGTYSLTQPASNATALIIREGDGGVTEQTYDSYLGTLVEALGTFARSTDGLKRYTNAKKAYDSAIKNLYYANTASGNSAQKLSDALTSAIAEWDTLQKGTRRTVGFVATLGGEAVLGITVQVTDAWGNPQAITGGEASLLVGSTYSYTLTKGSNAVSGRVEVGSQTTQVTAELPGGTWIGDVTLFNAVGDVTTAFEESDGIFLVPDYVMEDTDIGVYAYVENGIDCPASASLSVSYTDFTGAQASPAMGWNGTRKLNKLVTRGLTGNSFTLTASVVADDGTTQMQSREVEVQRVGSLSGISLKNADGVEQMAGFSAKTRSYVVECIEDSLTCKLAADASYGLTVDGTAVEAGQSIDLTATAEGSIHRLAVTANGKQVTYTVELVKRAAVTITLEHASDVTVELLNGAGGSVSAATQTATSSTYEVAPMAVYTYVATRDDVYHLRKEVLVEQDAIFQVSTPAAEDWVESIELYSGTGSRAMAYAHVGGWTFDNAQRSYSWIVGDIDTATALSIKATSAGSTAGVSAVVTWNNQKSGASVRNPVKAATLATGGKASLAYFHRKGTVGNSADLVLTAAQTTEAGETLYQDFQLSYVVQATLGDLTVSCQGSEMIMTPVGADEDAEAVFDRDIYNYEVRVPESASSVDLDFAFPAGSDSDDLVYGTYAMDFNGESLAYATEGLSRTVALEEGDTEIAITVGGTTDPTTLTGTYKVKVIRAATVPVKVVTTPADASVTVIQSNNNQRIWPSADGTYSLMDTFAYRYTVACENYVGTKGSFTAAKGMDDLQVTLQAAPESPDLDKATSAAWPYFRADENNNGVVDYATPTTSDDASLYWATKLGDGYSSGATGCPILVDGYLYTYANTHIYKVDTVSGEVVATGDMVASSSFAINSPAYADGMIFVGLSKGRVQAFNAKTLESMWVYADELGGQPNCPITCKNGRVYTGFWNAETRQANFVCLTTTDEDPSSVGESKIPLWTHTDNGFYWAGAYAADGFVLVPTDDGDSGYLTNGGQLLSLDARTGKVISKVTGLAGDVRSSVCYDAATDRYYFTSKGGYFYGVSVGSDGVIDQDSLSALHLYNYADSATQPPMSTCTPCIYNGRAYIGVSGTGQFTSYSGHNITVIDLATNRIAYTVRTQGYPQTSGLVTTAYDSGDGTVYVYFFDNYTPGVLRVLKDKPGQTEADATVAETSPEGVTYDCAEVLFTPSGAQAQYAICSPVVDDYGTIYFKNDSAFMMAVGPKITKIEVTRQPPKLSYKEGETFDATGMMVMATYSNGKTRDVTRYVTVDTTTPLTADDMDMEISFDHVMYHDQDGKAGVALEKPSTSVTISVEAAAPVVPQPQSIAGKAVKLSASTLTWTGKAQKPAVSIAGLNAGTDYAVSYSNNVKVGKATVTVTGKGAYAGTCKASFTIIPKVAAKPSVKVGKKSITVGKWAATGAASYLVQVKNKGGKWVTKKKLSSPKKVVIKKLKSGKKYQVRIVSVSSVKTVAGKASAAKKVK